MTYAVATDVTNRWGKPATEIPAEVLTLITTRLDDVERAISRRLTKLGRTIAGDLTAATYLEADLIQVESEVVLTLAKNPEGFTSESDGSYTYEISQALTTGSLEITSPQWEMLGVIRSNISILEPYVRRPMFPLPWTRW